MKPLRSGGRLRGAGRLLHFAGSALVRGGALDCHAGVMPDYPEFIPSSNPPPERQPLASPAASS